MKPTFNHQRSVNSSFVPPSKQYFRNQTYPQTHLAVAMSSIMDSSNLLVGYLRELDAWVIQNVPSEFGFLDTFLFIEEKKKKGDFCPDKPELSRAYESLNAIHPEFDDEDKMSNLRKLVKATSCGFEGMDKVRAIVWHFGIEYVKSDKCGPYLDEKFWKVRENANDLEEKFEMIGYWEMNSTKKSLNHPDLRTMVNLDKCRIDPELWVKIFTCASTSERSQMKYRRTFDDRWKKLVISCLKYIKTFGELYLETHLAAQLLNWSGFNANKYTNFIDRRPHEFQEVFYRCFILSAIERVDRARIQLLVNEEEMIPIETSMVVLFGQMFDEYSGNQSRATQNEINKIE